MEKAKDLGLLALTIVGGIVVAMYIWHNFGPDTGA